MLISGRVVVRSFAALSRRVKRSLDAGAVGCGGRHRGDRWLEIGHHDGAGELARGIGEHARHQRTVAQMQVPIVW